MRELTVQEMDQASGGILPLLGFVIAVAGKVAGTGTATGWAISSAGVLLGSYQLADYLYNLKER